MIMALTKCKYCEHGNPPDSKYCNVCGATLTLAPCPHCGAVNEVTATACYQCRGSLQESSKDALVPALPVAAVPQPSPRQPSLAIVSTVVVSIVAFIGYYAYRHYSLVSQPQSAAANNEAKRSSGPVQPGSTPGAAATPAVPVTATAESPVLPARAVRAPPTQTDNAGKAGELEPPRLGPCTERVAALGLCVPTPVPKQEVKATAAVPTPVARPRTSNVGKTGELEPPRLGPCTERVAALGLCTPAPVPEKEVEATAAVPTPVARPRTGDGGEPCTAAVAALGLCTPISK